VDRLLGELYIPKDSVAGREALEDHLEVRRARADGVELQNIRRGWCLGGKTSGRHCWPWRTSGPETAVWQN